MSACRAGRVAGRRWLPDRPPEQVVTPALPTVRPDHRRPRRRRAG